MNRSKEKMITSDHMLRKDVFLHCEANRFHGMININSKHMRNILVSLFFLIAAFACNSDYAPDKRDMVFLNKRNFIVSDTSVKVSDDVRITLVPYSCTKFRISMFPFAKK
jgi:hypothetical protein